MYRNDSVPVSTIKLQTVINNLHVELNAIINGWMNIFVRLNAVFDSRGCTVAVKSLDTLYIYVVYCVGPIIYVHVLRTFFKVLETLFLSILMCVRCINDHHG